MAVVKELRKDKDNLDQNLDFDPFKTSDFDGQFDQELDKPKSRGVISSVFHGTVKGAKEELFSTSFIGKRLDQALPDSYGTLKSEANRVTGTVEDVYNYSTNKLKPQLAKIAKRVDKLVPQESTFFRKISDKFKELTGADDSAYSGESIDTQRNTSIAGQIADIFTAQKESEVEEKARESVKEDVKEQISQERHLTNFGVISTISDNISKLTNYNEKINQGFQKKSLELQFRQYFLLQDLLNTAKQYNAVFEKQNEGIVKNTSLPEYVKIHNSEKFKELSKNRLINEVHDKILGRDSMLGRGLDTIKRKAKSKIDEYSGMLGGVDEMIDSLQSASEMLESFGGNKTESIAEMVGKEAMDKLGSRFAKPLKEDSEQHAGLKGTILSALQKFQNPNKAINDFIDGRETTVNGEKMSLRKAHNTGNGSYLTEALTWLSKQFTNENLEDEKTVIDGEKVSDLDKTASTGVTRRMQLALTDVIPGYLSRMHSSIFSLQRTAAMHFNLISGGRAAKLDVPNEAPGPMLVFDYKSASFISKSTMDKIVKTKIEDKLNQYSHASSMGSLLSGSGIDITKAKEKGTKEEVIEFFNWFSHKEDLWAKGREEIYKTDKFRLLKNKESKKIISDSLKYLDKDDNEALSADKKMTFMANLNRVRSDVTSPSMEIQDLASRFGTTTAAESMSASHSDLVKYDGTNGKLSLSSGRIYDEVNKRTTKSVIENGDKLVNINKLELPKYKLAREKFLNAEENEGIKKSLNSVKKDYDSVSKRIKKAEKDKLVPSPDDLKEMKDLYKEYEKIYEAIKAKLKPTSPAFESFNEVLKNIKVEEDKFLKQYPASDINLKTDIKPFSPSKALDAIKNTKIFNWKYKKDKGPEGEATGPMAQDVQKNIGNRAAPGGKALDMVSMNGANMAAIQELDRKQSWLQRMFTSFKDNKKPEADSIEDNSAVEEKQPADVTTEGNAKNAVSHVSNYLSYDKNNKKINIRVEITNKGEEASVLVNLTDELLMHGGSNFIIKNLKEKLDITTYYEMTISKRGYFKYLAIKVARDKDGNYTYDCSVYDKQAVKKRNKTDKKYEIIDTEGKVTSVNKEEKKKEDSVQPEEKPKEIEKPKDDLKSLKDGATKELGKKLLGYSEKDYLREITLDTKIIRDKVLKGGFGGGGGSGGSLPGFTDGEGYANAAKNVIRGLLEIGTNGVTDLTKGVVKGTLKAKDKIVVPATDAIVGGVKKFGEKYGEDIIDGGKYILNKGFDLVSSAYDSAKNVVTNVIPKQLEGLKKFGKRVYDSLEKAIFGDIDLYDKYGKCLIKELDILSGNIFDSATGKALTTLEDIYDAKGDLVNRSGKVLMTVEERAQGIFDKYGKTLNTKFQIGAKLLVGSAVLIGKGIKKTFNKLLDASETAKGVTGSILGTIKKYGGRLMGDFSSLTFPGLGFINAESHNVLVDIRDLLNERLPGEKKDFKKKDIKVSPETDAKPEDKEEEKQTDNKPQDEPFTLKGMVDSFFSEIKKINFGEKAKEFYNEALTEGEKRLDEESKEGTNVENKASEDNGKKGSLVGNLVSSAKSKISSMLGKTESVKYINGLVYNKEPIQIRLEIVKVSDKDDGNKYTLLVIQSVLNKDGKSISNNKYSKIPIDGKPKTEVIENTLTHSKSKKPICKVNITVSVDDKGNINLSSSADGINTDHGGIGKDDIKDLRKNNLIKKATKILGNKQSGKLLIGGGGLSDKISNLKNRFFPGENKEPVQGDLFADTKEHKPGEAKADPDEKKSVLDFIKDKTGYNKLTDEEKNKIKTTATETKNKSIERLKKLPFGNSIVNKINGFKEGVAKAKQETKAQEDKAADIPVQGDLFAEPAKQEETKKENNKSEVKKGKFAKLREKVNDYGYKGIAKGTGLLSKAKDAVLNADVKKAGGILGGIKGLWDTFKQDSSGGSSNLAPTNTTTEIAKSSKDKTNSDGHVIKGNTYVDENSAKNQKRLEEERNAAKQVDDAKKGGGGLLGKLWGAAKWIGKGIWIAAKWIPKIAWGIMKLPSLMFGGIGKILGKIPALGKVGAVLSRGLGIARTATMAAGLLGGPLTALGSAAASLALTPVGLGLIGGAALAYGGYKLYKHMNRDNIDDFTKIRLHQYGLLDLDVKNDSEVSDRVKAIVDLESYINDKCLTTTPERVKINSSVTNSEEGNEKIMGIFGFSPEDMKQNNQAVFSFHSWFSKRFIPVFERSATAINRTKKDRLLTDADAMSVSEKLSYLNEIDKDDGESSRLDSPFKSLPSLSDCKDAVKAAIEKLKEEISKGKIDNTNKLKSQATSDLNKIEKEKQERKLKEEKEAQAARDAANDKIKSNNVQPNQTDSSQPPLDLTKPQVNAEDNSGIDNKNVAPVVQTAQKDFRDKLKENKNNSDLNLTKPQTNTEGNSSKDNKNVAPVVQTAQKDFRDKLKENKDKINVNAGAEGNGPADESVINKIYDKDLQKTPTLDKVNSVFKNNFLNMAKEFKSATGERLKVTSGYRTYEDQVEMKALKTRQGKPGEAADPTTSQHEYGLAIDSDSTQLKKAADLGLLDKYGIDRPLMAATPKRKGEKWHVEPIGIQSVKKRIRNNATAANDAIIKGAAKNGVNTAELNKAFDDKVDDIANFRRKKQEETKKEDVALDQKSINVASLNNNTPKQQEQVKIEKSRQIEQNRSNAISEKPVISNVSYVPDKKPEPVQPAPVVNIRPTIPVQPRREVPVDNNQFSKVTGDLTETNSILTRSLKLHEEMVRLQSDTLTMLSSIKECMDNNDMEGIKNALSNMSTSNTNQQDSVSGTLPNKPLDIKAPISLNRKKYA